LDSRTHPCSQSAPSNYKFSNDDPIGVLHVIVLYPLIPLPGLPPPLSRDW
jgi:hypothetical protein